MPTVSVIVPVYNAQKHLVQCVDSILAQTVTDLELILVDDGSRDQSGAMCDEYAHNHANVRVIHKENQGQTPARQDGLRLAAGEYVAFVDSDDWLEADMYENLLHLARKHEADMVITGYLQEFGDRTEAHINHIPSGVYRDQQLQQLRRLSVFCRECRDPAISTCLWTKLFRRDKILDTFLAIPGALRIGEDTLCTWGLLAKAACVVVDNDHTPYHYRTWEGSITQRYYADYARDLFFLQDHLSAIFSIEDPQMAEAMACYYVKYLLSGIHLEISRLNPAGFFQKCAGVGRFCQGDRLDRALEKADLSVFDPREQKKLKLLRKKAAFQFLVYHKLCNLLSKLKRR